MGAAVQPGSRTFGATAVRLVPGRTDDGKDVFLEDLTSVVRPSPEVLRTLELPDVRATLELEGRVESLVVTFDVALAVVRDMHALAGERGLDRLQTNLTRIRELYAKPGMLPAPTSAGKDAFLALIGLHLHAIAAFRSHLAEVARRIRQEALGVARDRLAAAGREVAAEAIRYLGFDPAARRPLMGWLAAAEPEALPVDFPDRVAGLREGVAALRKAEAELREARVRPRMFFGDALDRKFRTAAERELDREAAALADAAIDAAQIRLIEETLTLARRHPIAVKLSRSATEDLSDDKVLAAAIRQVLVDTLAAGRELETLLTRDPQEIWTYPTLVNEALVRQGCVPESTPGVVARERLADGALLESVVHTTSAVTGVLSLATVALGVAAPPVVVAVFVADLVASLADALLVYYRYYQQKLAFDAVLSPDLSIAAEPNLLWAAFMIGLDLLALLPPRPRVP